MNRYIEAYRCLFLSLRQYVRHMETGASAFDMPSRLLFADWDAANRELVSARVALITGGK